MRNLQRILLCVLLVVTNSSIALAAATSPASSCPSASSSTIPLGALSGSDADALAQTLSSIFHGEFVVTACADPKSSDDASSSTPAGPGADSASSSKHTLLVKSHDGSPANLQCASSNPSGCALKGLAASLDRDNFKGGALNSTYVVRVGKTEFAQKLVKYFAHPSPDIDVEPAINGYVAGCEDAAKPPILLGSVSAGWLSGTLPNRLKTRSLILLYPTSLPVTVLPGAQREAAEAHLLGFPLVSPSYLTTRPIVEG